MNPHNIVFWIEKSEFVLELRDNSKKLCESKTKREIGLVELNPNSRRKEPLKVMDASPLMLSTNYP